MTVASDFHGTFTPRLDDKGRLFIPARYREDFRDGLVMTTGQEGCIYLFPVAEFRTISRAMAQVPSSAANVRAMVRMFRANATPEESPDRQGRITIPAALRTWAGLDRDCAVLGNGNRLEIWAADRWTSYQDDHAEGYASYSQGSEEVVIPGL